VAAFADLLDLLRRERWDVVRLAARDQTLVYDDLLVDPVGACVADVGLQRRPGGDGATTEDPGPRRESRVRDR
jgi:hypothetical protein